LKPALRQAALELPPGFNPRTLALARNGAWDAGRDDAAIVRRALAWIHGEFAYTLDTPPWGRNAIDEFLFDGKAGYCQHFSSAFVVLMRGAGIPARVVTGYAGGYRNPIGGYWIVRRSDAHAWTEVWMPERGWVRIDPTAAVAPERVYDTLADRAPVRTVCSATSGDRCGTPAIGCDAAGTTWSSVSTPTARRGCSPHSDWTRINGRQLAMLFGAFATLALLWMVWLSARGQREPDPVLRAWHRLGERYGRFGLARESHETAAHWVDRVARTHLGLASGLREISHRFAIWRYAEPQPGTHAPRAAKDLVRALRSHRPKHSNP
jgi:hypothetical protein